MLSQCACYYDLSEIWPFDLEVMNAFFHPWTFWLIQSTYFSHLLCAFLIWSNVISYVGEDKRKHARYFSDREHRTSCILAIKLWGPSPKTLFTFLALICFRAVVEARLVELSLTSKKVC